MNINTVAKMNKISLTLSKCFYKVKWFTPGRWIGFFRQKRCLSILEKEGRNLLLKEYNYENLSLASNMVFVMWYQGFDNLPEVIEKCLVSIKENLQGKKIVLISRENVGQYIDLPDYIYKKVDEGKISKTHFSDVIRVALLYKYGGTWIDAAAFITKKIPDDYFNHIFYSPSGIHSEIKKDFRYLFQKTPGWNISFQGSCKKSFPLYEFLYNFYIKWFEKYDVVVDYFQTDFLISLFLKYNERFRIIINEQKINNTREFDLALMMNKILSKSTRREVDKVLSENCIHKLTYKKNWRRCINGKQTVYDYTIFDNLQS